MSNNRGETKQHRTRQDETLFIDARKLGHLISRRQRELSREDIERIASTYHAFRNLNPTTPYEDIEGFCKVASRADIAAQGYVLTSGRYVGTESADEEELPAAERLELVRTQLLEELDKSAEVEKRLRELLGRVTGDE
jgi:type I restriction enzyme M protein